MLKNYWLIAIRKLRKHKVHALINVLGLTVGVASCLIIFLITHFELGYDRFHADGDHIYRIVTHETRVDIRKVLGGRRKDIVFQFLSETFLLTLLAVILSLLITPPVITLLHQWMPPGLHLELSTSTLLFLLGIILITSLLVRWYPAKVISALLPVLSLKGQATRNLLPNRFLHRSLIVFQFSISLVFIIGTVIVSRQLHYILNKDLGFDKDAIITFRASGPVKDREVLAQQLRGVPGVAVVSRHEQTPQADFQESTSFKSASGSRPKHGNRQPSLRCSLKWKDSGRRPIRTTGSPTPSSMRPSPISTSRNSASRG
jgi:hypothetical protein